MTDWVTERSQCSPANSFERLKAEIKDDIKARTVLIKSGDYKLSFSEENKNRLIVTLEGILPGKVPPVSINESVWIELSGKVIIVRNLEEELKATLTLNEEGKCRLKIKGIEHDFWRVRQMLLEDLFFNIV
ncbi:MAG: hypothetical protein LAO76_02795 [Acidobacteriia bacterium]|nr:hypothetical protein [Terriglobia bacterium]